MADLAERIRIRVLPALLTALGVAGLAAGVLSLTSPVAADPLPSASPTSVAIQTATPTLAPTASPLITFPPIPSRVAPSPSANPSAPVDRVATRVRAAALGIDLPVLPPGGEHDYPLCDAAQYFRVSGLRPPGMGGSTYLYGHARDGMFGPLLEASKIQNGKAMIGMVVEVWTSDDQRFLYEIVEVRRHVPYRGAFDDVLNRKEETLWLQTSEGSGGETPKLQIVATPFSQEAADHEEAHPPDMSVDCTPADWRG